MIELNRIYNEDCLEGMKRIPDGSVDLVLTDPPYGTMKGIDDKHDWDIILPTKEMFEELSRVVRQNGKVVLFSQEPYTSHLINNAIVSLPFCYRAIWKKDSFGNGRMAKKAMVSLYEDILIFQKIHDSENVNPLRNYFADVLRYIGLNSCKDVNAILGHRRAEHCFYVTGNKNGSTQFSLCTEATYLELINKFGIDKMDGFIPYEKLSEINERYTSTFNLWQGGKSKSNVLEYSKDNDGYHPTQKPVKLLEDLIQTYSNEGDTVLDFTMGSGTTAVACINTNRNYIGFELSEEYCKIAEKRISSVLPPSSVSSDQETPKRPEWK